MISEIDKGTVLKYMKESLTLYTNNPHLTLLTTTLEKMVDVGLIDPPNREEYNGFYKSMKNKNPNLVEILIECYMYLLNNGIIIPEPDPPYFGTDKSWNNYKVTNYGKEWIKSDDYPLPEDIDGTISFIKKEIPELDDVIFQYFAEALQTFNGNFIFASAVMIGAASEKLIYIASNEINKFELNNEVQEKIRDGLERRKLKTLLDTFPIALDELIKKLNIPYDIHEGCHHYLSTIFDAIRIQRNDAVHPTVSVISKEKLRLLIPSFTCACIKVYKLMDWLKNNQ